MEDRVPADRHVAADDGMGADRGAGAECRPVSDDRGRMDAGRRAADRRMEELDGPDEGEVRVRREQRRESYRRCVAREDHRSGPGGRELRCVSGIGDEGQRRRPRVVDRRHVDDLDGAVTAELATERAGDVGELHRRPFSRPPGSRPTIDERRTIVLALPRAAW